MGFFLNNRLLAQARDDAALLAYPHAQRTGGRTVRKNVFAHIYGEALVYNRHYLPGAKPWKSLSDKDLRGYCAWTDLSNYRDIGLKRPCLWLAVLRHPLYRAASLYYYVQQKEGHPDQEIAKRTNMEDFYREASGGNPKYYRNMQCMRVCGRADAHTALDLIKAKYLGVGFTNDLSSFVAALGSALGWPAIELKTMEADEKRYDEAITPRFRDMVLEENAADLALFEAVSKGGF